MTGYYITKTTKWNLMKENGSLPITIISSDNEYVVKCLYDKLLNGYYKSDEQLYQDIFKFFSAGHCILGTM